MRNGDKNDNSCNQVITDTNTLTEIVATEKTTALRNTQRGNNDNNDSNVTNIHIIE